MVKIRYLVFASIVLLTIGCDHIDSGDDAGQESVKTDPVQTECIHNKGDDQKQDYQRLEAIVSKIRKSRLDIVSVVFSPASMQKNVVPIDYNAFCQLGDDAVAAMIIRTRLERDISPEYLSDSNGNVDNNRHILNLDEKTGYYAAQADFKMDGFREYLEASYLFGASGLVSQSLRIESFKRGYARGTMVNK